MVSRWQQKEPAREDREGKDQLNINKNLEQSTPSILYGEGKYIWIFKGKGGGNDSHKEPETKKNTF